MVTKVERDEAFGIIIALSIAFDIRLSHSRRCEWELGGGDRDVRPAFD